MGWEGEGVYIRVRTGVRAAGRGGRGRTRLWAAEEAVSMFLYICEALVGDSSRLPGVSKRLDDGLGPGAAALSAVNTA